MNRVYHDAEIEVWLDTLDRPFRFVSPFRGDDFVLMLVVADPTITKDEQARLSREIVEQGCRYAVCTGHRDSTWDDSIDLAHRSFGSDSRFVMTTWHTDEPIGDVVEYLRWNTVFEDFVPSRFLVVCLGPNTQMELEVAEAVGHVFGR